MSAQGKAPRDSDAAQTTNDGVLAASVGDFAADQIDHGIDISDQLRPATIRAQFHVGSTGALSNPDGRSNPDQRAFEEAT